MQSVAFASYNNLENIGLAYKLQCFPFTLFSRS